MDKIQLGHGTRLTELTTQTAQKDSTPLGSFTDALRNAVNEVDQLQHEADTAITNAQTGKAGSLHEAIIALEKADVSFRTMLQIRNKVIEAYQEIMRMQV
ncbi:MAG: flagellar hook-basal body complex protein FliE [Deltaproteobacteria bacterium]|nr:flagellar hook-basal body complex protein FliE [Deltaproteobacteria bacterium]